MKALLVICNGNCVMPAQDAARHTRKAPQEMTLSVTTPRMITLGHECVVMETAVIKTVAEGESTAWSWPRRHGADRPDGDW